jgi:hypothetical protein
MQIYMFAAGCIALVVDAIHSVLGEILIFGRMRNRGLIPTVGAPLLRERHVRILWVSWHIVTIFGWAFAAILLRIAFPSNAYPIQAFVESVVVVSMLAGAFLIFIGTKGMHPEWRGC